MTPRTLRKLLRFARKMRAQGWHEGVMYAQKRNERTQPKRDDAGRFAGKGKCVR